MYEVKDVVCDYGIYEDGELILFCNNRQNAELIQKIMQLDSKHKVLKIEDMKNNKLKEIIDFFELEQGGNRREIIEYIFSRMVELQGYGADEIWLKWDNEKLTLLEDFIFQFYIMLEKKICNVIKSYQED